MIMIILVTSIIVINDYYTTKFTTCQVNKPTGKTQITIRLNNDIRSIGYVFVLVLWLLYNTVR